MQLRAESAVQRHVRVVVMPMRLAGDADISPIDAPSIVADNVVEAGMFDAVAVVAVGMEKLSTRALVPIGIAIVAARCCEPPTPWDGRLRSEDCEVHSLLATAVTSTLVT